MANFFKNDAITIVFIRDSSYYKATTMLLEKDGFKM